MTNLEPAPREPRRPGPTAAALVALCLALFGCSDQRRLEIAKGLVDAHFEEIRRGEFEASTTDYSRYFFEHKVARDEWIAVLEDTQIMLGDYRGRELIESSVWTTSGNHGLGTYVLIHYKVQYSKKSSGHLIYVFLPLPWGRPGIVGHQISTRGLWRPPRTRN